MSQEEKLDNKHIKFKKTKRAFKCFLESQPGVKGSGSSKEEMLGDMLLSHPGIFGVEFTWDMNDHYTERYLAQNQKNQKI